MPASPKQTDASHRACCPEHVGGRICELSKNAKLSHRTSGRQGEPGHDPCHGPERGTTGTTQRGEACPCHRVRPGWDEQSRSTRGEASLHVVDVHRSLVWASVPPVTVDGERWMVVVWSVQEQGPHWHTTVSDGGCALAEALSQTKALASHQRDVWHLFHLAAHVQGRADRSHRPLHDPWVTVKNQAERVAQGQKARGHVPTSDMQAHLVQLEQTRIVAEGIASPFSELHRLPEAVMPASRPDGAVRARSAVEQ